MEDLNAVGIGQKTITVNSYADVYKMLFKHCLIKI